MDAYEWLGIWEPIEAPGRHCRLVPAEYAAGYQYIPTWYGSKAPRWNQDPPYSMWERVGRAIPVEGSVNDPPPSWEKSPQARYWLEKEKTPILARIRAWLKRSAL